jgi:multidrug efflux pump subunit AcrA (membrane-fusion protein)
MKLFISKLKQYASKHKFVTAVVLIILAYGGYTAYGAMTKPATVTKYVVQNVAKGTVIATVSGSGQVQAATTISVKPQTSETVTKIYVKPGDHVAAGQLLMQLDTTNEAKSVTQAELSLQSAQLSLAKLQQISTSSLLQNQGSLASAEQNLLNASTTLAKGYQNGFATVASTFVDLQTLMDNLNNFMTGTQIDIAHVNPDAYVNILPEYLRPGAAPYHDAVFTTYAASVSAYQKNLADYHATDRTADRATLDALFEETYQTTQLISDTVKAGSNFLNYITTNYPSDQGAVLPPIAATHQTDFGNYTSSINADVSSISGIISGITNAEQSFVNAQSSLAQANESYNELVAGPDDLDLLSQNINIQNAQLSLQTAQQNLADDSIRAPIAGIVATMPSIAGETVASPAATIASDHEVAVVTLNEIDAAKIQVGNKVSLSFDALPEVSLAGSVVEIDPVGTVSQGVVNYNVQIGFSQPADTSSTSLVKPGMSVTADIVTQADQNVIVVPNSAVHTQGATSYVLAPAAALSADDVVASMNGGMILSDGTTMVPITIGIANDTQTEVVSGLNVGDQIITQTISSSGAASTASTGGAGGTNALRALGGGAVFVGGAGGGTARGGFTGGTGR